MRSRVEIAKQFSQANNSNVLITGETGSGGNCSLCSGGTTLVLPPTVRKKDLAKELGVSRTTLWRMTKRQEEAARKQREETSNS